MQKCLCTVATGRSSVYIALSIYGFIIKLLGPSYRNIGGDTYYICIVTEVMYLYSLMRIDTPRSFFLYSMNKIGPRNIPWTQN